jgi:hypothetical protein
MVAPARNPVIEALNELFRAEADRIHGRVANDFSREVTAKLEARARVRAHLERPFVPDVADEDLFGRPVKP